MGGRFVVVIAIFALVNADGVDKKELKKDDLKRYYIFVPGESSQTNFVDQVGNLYKALKKDLHLNGIKYSKILLNTALKVPIDKAYEEQFRKLFEDYGLLLAKSAVPKDLYVYQGSDPHHQFFSERALNYMAENVEERRSESILLDETTSKPTTTTEAAALNEVRVQPTNAIPASGKHGCLGHELYREQIREYEENKRKAGCCL